MKYPIASSNVRTSVVAAIRDVLLDAGIAQVRAPMHATMAAELLRWAEGGRFQLIANGNELTLHVTAPRPQPMVHLPSLSEDVRVMHGPSDDAADEATLTVCCPGEVALGDVEELVDPNARLSIVEAMARDLEARNQELAALYEELESANRGTLALNAQLEEAMEARSRFLASMSHEIRTPLNGIMGMAHLLQSDLPSGEGRRRLDVIQNSSKHLLTVINDILDLAKIEAGKMDLEAAPFTLRSCIEECLGMVASNAHAQGIEIAYHWDPEVQDGFLGDPGRVRQVLLNLVGNAIKFTKEGGVTIHVRNNNGVVQVDVEDSGVGIPQDRIHAIFAPFTQANASTTRRYGGTGLGLAICKHLINAMGGEIFVTSQVGVGSTFSFTLPLESAVVPDHFEPDQRLVGKRAIVVDDNRVNADCMKAMLEAWGMVVVAYDGPVAVLQSDVTNVDLAVIDQVMPILRGSSLARELHRTNPDLAVVIASSESVAAAAIDEYNGVRAAIAKPLIAERFHEAILAAMFGDADEEAHVVSEFDGRMAARNPLSILVAEDDAINQILAREYLAEFGYVIDVAGNGVEAVDMAKAKRYDLIFMDVQMPLLDGLEATRKIRAEHAHQPRIVALTAHALLEYRTKCFDAGMDAVLTKPVTPEGFAQHLAASAPNRSRDGIMERMAERTLQRLRELCDIWVDASADVRRTESHKIRPSCTMLAPMIDDRLVGLASMFEQQERDPADDGLADAIVDVLREILESHPIVASVC